MRIGALPILRVIVMMRRIWKSVDRLAVIENARLELEKEQMALEHPEWRKAGYRIPDPKNARMTDISVANVDDWKDRYKSQHPEEDEYPRGI